MATLAMFGSLHQPDDLVFHTDRGTALNPNNVLNRVLHPACKRAGIPIVSWHNFRYTFSTWANPTGESIKALQSQLGHTDARLTLRVYARAMSQDEGERERLQTLVDGRSLGTNGHWGSAIASDVSSPGPLADPETSELAGTSELELVGLEPTTSCMP